jgi:hypothetical protein
MAKVGKIAPTAVIGTPGEKNSTSTDHPPQMQVPFIFPTGWAVHDNNDTETPTPACSMAAEFNRKKNPMAMSFVHLLLSSSSSVFFYPHVPLLLLASHSKTEIPNHKPQQGGSGSGSGGMQLKQEQEQAEQDQDLRTTNKTFAMRIFLFLLMPWLRIPHNHILYPHTEPRLKLKLQTELHCTNPDSGLGGARAPEPEPEPTPTSATSQPRNPRRTTCHVGIFKITFLSFFTEC